MPTHDQDQASASQAPLSPYGRKQAQALARYMRRHQVDTVYSSVYRRARETAGAIREAVRGPLFEDSRFNEQVLARERLDQATAKEIKRRMLEDPDHVPPGGTSLRDSVDDFLRALDDVERASHGHACIVSHGFLMEAALRRRFKLDPGTHLAEGSVTILRVVSGETDVLAYNVQPFFRLRVWNRLATSVRRILEPK